MSYSPNVQSLLDRRNDILSKSPHTPAPTVAQLGEVFEANPNMPMPIIISCADPRVVPESIFGLGVGEAGVIRNAGGNVQKALPDLLAIDTVMRLTDVIIIKHTDCGTTHFHDDKVREVIKARDGVTGEMKDSVDKMSFGGGVNSVHAALKRDVEFFKETPLVRAELRSNVAGFVYDIKTGELSPAEQTTVAAKLDRGVFR